MQIDKLQIELRPRSHAQALDLGFALLRSHAGAAYKAFLALWLPLIGAAMVMTAFFPTLTWLWAVIAWWFKPMLERAPLYVLSRQVFGATVTWQEAVRAWPRQLGGGAWRLLVWGRIIISTGRGLMQPVWQLEMARGSVATMRQRVLGANGTGQAAFWFGVVCCMLEGVLQVGLIAFISMFAGDGQSANPFALLFGDKSEEAATVLRELLWLGSYAVGTAIIAPIYTACCFTLYLNRRASLEAWDLEIQLRQIQRPPTVKTRPFPAQPLALLMAAVLFACTLGAAPDAHAEEPAATAPELTSPTCDGPKLEANKRAAPASARQAQVRQQLDQVYAHKHLRGYECVQVWLPKPDKEKKEDPKLPKLPKLDFLASLFKVVVIALAIGLVGYLLYRYRDALPSFRRGPGTLRATEVGGLDIRAESLPPDVTAQVRLLWASGERRAALALLYRATLSRLVSDDGLNLRQGDTEGDCLRAATESTQAARLAQGRLDVAVAATTLWLNGAYGERWPNEAVLYQRCNEWDLQFGTLRETRA